MRIRDQATAYPFLLLTGLIVVGWTGLGWTFHRFEWGYLYDWIDAGFVEEKAALFLIPIAGRYLIPMVVVRVLLAEVFEGQPYPQRVVNLLAGLKTLSLVLIMWGMAGLLLRSEVFAEAMQQTSLWLLLSAVLFVPTRSRA